MAVYEGLVANDRFADLVEVENLTNPRLKAQERIADLAGEDPHTSARLQNWNHAPFAYGNPDGSIFFDELTPCLEVAIDRQTALAVSVARRERFLGYTHEPATGLDIVLINRYQLAGGASQEITVLRRWELGYELLTYLFAILLAGLNVRGLTAHAPLIHLATISLVFTFGAGVVSRTSSRLRLCMMSVILAVLPTIAAMLVHAASDHAERFHSEFFLLEAFLLVAVGLMSLQSAAHLYASAVEHLSTKQDMAKLARYDPLTGLPNRLLVRETFQERFSFSRRSHSQLAIHYVDLDGFKAVNDRYGHLAGDQLLVEMAARLTATIRSSDLACRLGGDEFLIIQSDVRHRDQAELLARRIIRQISENFEVGGATTRVTASVGVAMVPECGIELDRLIGCADTALYLSKARGKAQVHFCNPDDEPLPGRAVA